MSDDTPLNSQAMAIEDVGAVEKYPLTIYADNDRVAELRLSMLKFRDMLFTVIAKGELTQIERPVVRLQSYCSIGQTLGGALCDCDAQFEASKKIIADSDAGVLILNWSQEGRGAGLEQHFRAHVLHENTGVDSVEAYEQLGLPVDPREYHSEVEILRHLGLKRIKLLTNNPQKIVALTNDGFDVQRAPLIMPVTEYNKRQMEVRAKKLCHSIPWNGDQANVAGQK